MMAAGSTARITFIHRYIAAEFSFYLAIPVMFGASLLKLLKFGLSFTFALNQSSSGIPMMAAGSTARITFIHRFQMSFFISPCLGEQK